MSPLEFALWLNGASGIIGETPPTQEQWDLMRANLSQVVGKIVAAKLLDRADELVKRDADTAIAKMNEYELHKKIRDVEEKFRMESIRAMPPMYLGRDEMAGSMIGVSSYQKNSP